MSSHVLPKIPIVLRAGLSSIHRSWVNVAKGYMDDELRALADFDRVLHYLSHPCRHGGIGPEGRATDA